jgi:hypothetical protein
VIAEREEALPPTRDTALRVDHVGIVVRDLAAEVAAWRAQGFSVSEPVPLMGSDASGRSVPLGQSSAHVVFANAYVELSSPHPGANNHLEPYLARGEGVRILVLATKDADAARERLAVRRAVSPVMAASRAVVVEGTGRMAGFRWFPLPFDIVPGVLSAVVEHLTPEIVFHPSLARHPNGLTRMSRVVATGDPSGFVPPPGEDGASQAPLLALAAGEGEPVIDALAFDGPGMRERTFLVTAHAGQ